MINEGGKWVGILNSSEKTGKVGKINEKKNIRVCCGFDLGKGKCGLRSND